MAGKLKAVQNEGVERDREEEDGGNLEITGSRRIRGFVLKQ